MSEFKILPAERTENIAYAVRDIIVLANEVAKSGKEMLYLNIGDPNKYDFAPPKAMVEATYKAMLGNYNGYAPSSGVVPALESIEREAERKGITNINDIFITTGASEAIDLVLSALVNTGENVLTPSPGYPLYTAVASKFQAYENKYDLDEENGWQPDIEDIKSKINDKTKGIVVINPNNPTGANNSKETLLEIIKIAKEHNLVIFSDEIYDKLLFDDEEHICLASLDSEVPIVTIGGLSKNYLAPGFRIGWAIVSGNRSTLAEYIEGINKMLRARLSANHPEQYGIPAALDGDQSHLVIAREKLTSRRNLTVEMLNSVEGISCETPKGAFYAYPKLDLKDKNDSRFVAELIKATGVVTVPGVGFGQVAGTNHMRIVFLAQEEKLEKAYKSIIEFYNIYKNEFELV